MSAKWPEQASQTGVKTPGMNRKPRRGCSCTRFAHENWGFFRPSLVVERARPAQEFPASPGLDPGRNHHVGPHCSRSSDLFGRLAPRVSAPCRAGDRRSALLGLHVRGGFGGSDAHRLAGQRPKAAVRQRSPSALHGSARPDRLAGTRPVRPSSFGVMELLGFRHKGASRIFGIQEPVRGRRGRLGLTTAPFPFGLFAWGMGGVMSRSLLNAERAIALG